MITQKEIYDYLKANPFKMEVWTGDLEDLNGKDYIFLDFLNDGLIPFDNAGTYTANIQITVATKDFTKRRKTVNYIRQKFNCSTTYENSREFRYYLARCSTSVMLYEKN